MTSNSIASPFLLCLPFTCFKCNIQNKPGGHKTRDSTSLRFPQNAGYFTQSSKSSGSRDLQGRTFSPWTPSFHLYHTSLLFVKRVLRLPFSVTLPRNHVFFSPHICCFASNIPLLNMAAFNDIVWNIPIPLPYHHLIYQILHSFNICSPAQLELKLFCFLCFWGRVSHVVLVGLKFCRQGLAPTEICWSLLP